MDLRIVSAQKEDCEKISNLLYGAFEEFQAKYTEIAFSKTAITTKEVELRLKEGQIWVAKLNEEIVGTIGGVEKNDNYYIRGMAVHPSTRGKRIGFLLLDKLETYARDRKYSILSLSTTPYLKSAIRLYENFGFQIVNEPPYEFYGTPLFNMKKRIN